MNTGKFILLVYLFSSLASMLASEFITAQPSVPDFRINSKHYTNNDWWDNLNPEIETDSEGNFIVVWADNYKHNLYMRKFDSTGTPLTLDIQINDISGSTGYVSPSVEIDGKGNCCIAWEDTRNNYSQQVNIYGQLFNKQCEPIGKNFIVNDSLGSATNQSSTAIGMHDSGEFIIVWVNSNNSYDIVAQRFNPSGLKLGSNFQINASDDSDTDWLPDIDVDDDGNFVVVWRNNSTSHSHTLMRIFNHKGMPITKDIRVNEKNSKRISSAPKVCCTINNNIIVTWADSRDYRNKIYCQYYDGSGIPLGNNHLVSSDSTWSNYHPAIAINDLGEFLIAWQATKNSMDEVHAQRYNPGFERVWENYSITNSMTLSNKTRPAISLFNNYVYTVWQDNRIGDNERDVFGKITLFDDDISTIRNKSNGVPINEFVLNASYPNPFNFSVNISFLVGREMELTVSIYNLMGQEIKSLYKGNLGPGEHKLQWNGFDNFGMVVNSGMYLAIFKYDNFIYTQKLVLIK